MIHPAAPRIRGAAFDDPGAAERRAPPTPTNAGTEP